MTVTIGTSVGRYLVRSLLGTGGMGEVFLAEDSELRRPVALKVLSANLSENEERVQRFIQEARATSALNHPNIITIYEIGQFGRARFIASEYIAGETLRDRTNRERLTLDETLEIAIQMASALSAAHDAGIVHRDIKPENVMLRADGLVKVLDFGVAKLSENSPLNEIGSDSETLIEIRTTPGLVVGTVVYMSPEQVRGKLVDARSDLWSLGVVLYETLTGKMPFGGETNTDKMAAILTSEPAPPSALNAAVVPEFERIIAKTLSKDREERYQTAKDLLVDLKRLQRQLDIEAEIQRTSAPTVTITANAEEHTTHPGGARTQENIALQSGALPVARRPLWLKASMAGVALALFSLIGYGVWRVHKVTPFARVEMRALTMSGNIVTAAISPDGKIIGFVKNERGKQSLWIRQTSLRTAEIRLTEPTADETFEGLSFTPDGGQLYFLLRPRNTSVKELYAVPLLGGQPPKKITADVDTPPAFAPDGKRFAFMRRNSQTGVTALMIARADGADERELTHRKSPYSYRLLPLAWSPDGNKIACAATNPSTDAVPKPIVQLAEINVADGAERIISSEIWNDVESIVWEKDGGGLIFAAKDLQNLLQLQVWFQPYPGGTPRKLSADLTEYRNLSLAAQTDEITARRTQVEFHVWTVDAAKSNAPPRRVSPTNADGTHGIAWTQDNRLIFSSALNGKNNLQKTALGGSPTAVLSTDDYVFGYPCATRDGRYVVFTSTQDDSYKLWRADADGGNLTQLTNENVEYLACSPDSRWVYYNTLTNGQTSLWRVPIEGGTPQQVSDKILVRPKISSDGTRLAAYYRPDAARSEWKIAILSLTDAHILQTPEIPNAVRLNSHYTWTADGKALIFTEIHDGIANLWRYPVDNQPPTQLTNFNDEFLPLIYDVAVSPDGATIAMVRGRRINDVVLITEKD